MKLKANELRKSSPTETELKNLKRNPIYLVLDNIIDTYNIGSLFRLADAVGVQIIAVEQSANSVSYSNLKPNFPCAIVVGNETHGMAKGVLKQADIVIELPMFGINKSFNVWGSAAVIAYK